MPGRVDDLIALGMQANLAVQLGHIEYAGDPTNNVTPAVVGQICHDTSNDDWYIAHALAAANWKIMAT